MVMRCVKGAKLTSNSDIATAGATHIAMRILWQRTNLLDIADARGTALLMARCICDCYVIRCDCATF
eukprot:SAG31_NODE_424_length_15826_cov_4.954664_16_plen_67_part_00